MTVTGQYDAQCFYAGITWSIANGTAPYTISINSIGFSSPWVTSSNVAQGAQGFDVGTTFSMHIIVTDAMGCQAEVQLYPSIPHLLGTSDYYIEYAVDGATGSAQVTWTDAQIACAPELLTYTIYHPETYVVLSTGLVGDAWTAQPGTGSWTLNDPLPPGRHVVTITGQVPCPPGSPIYPSYDCWRSLSPMDIWVPTSNNTGANLAIRMALGGVLTTAGLMNDDLRTAGLLPLADPYPGFGYVHTDYQGGGAISPSLLATAGNGAVVDWVLAEVRAANAPYTVLGSRPALLLRDGSVMDLDGDPFLNFPNLMAGSYRVSVRHRNHLGIMTTPFDLGVPVTMVNTLNINTGIYGGTSATAFARRLWPGDATGDGLVKYIGPNNDRDPLLIAIGGSTPTNVVSNVYSPLDVNMDGQIKYTGASNDRDVILTTVGGSTPNNVQVQQLP